MILISSIFILLFFFFFVIYSLGKLILDKLEIRLTFWEELLIGINIGSVIFTIVIFVLWRLNFYNLTYFFILSPPLYILFRFIKEKNFLLEAIRISKIDPILILILFISTLIPSLLVIRSGDVINGGLRMVGANGHDVLSYISLINNLQKSIPPQNPTFADEVIRNYHYLTFVFFSAIQYVTKISVLDLYFKLIMPFLALLFSSTIFIFVKGLVGEKRVSYLAVLMVCLSSNLYYLIRAFYPSANVSPSVFWIDEYTTRMVNPQLIFSYIIMLTIFYLMLKKKNSWNFKFILILSLLISSLVLFKAFAGVLVFASLSLLFIYNFFHKKYEYLFLLLTSTLITSILYLASNTKLSSTLFFSPFWFVKNMFESPDHLNYSEWELKRQTFLEKNNYIRIIQLYAQGILIFLLGNFGLRFLAFFQPLKNLGKIKETVIGMLIIATLGLILPQVFLVRGTVWNSIQFSYYSVFILGVLIVPFLNNLFRKTKNLFFLVFTLMWLSLLPGVYYSTNNYFLSIKDGDIFSSSLYQASLFLRMEEDGVVLIHPHYFNNTFIPAISGKNAFFADEKWLSVQTINFQKRKRETEDFFKNPQITSVEFLKENNIKYIFSNSFDLEGFNQSGINKIYQNDTITILKVE